MIWTENPPFSATPPYTNKLFHKPWGLSDIVTSNESESNSTQESLPSREGPRNSPEMVDFQKAPMDLISDIVRYHIQICKINMFFLGEKITSFQCRPSPKKHEFSQCFPTPNKTKTQLPAPYMWQQKTRQQPKITKKPFASNELLVIQDLSLESLHDLRGHCYLLTPMEPLKGYTVNLIEYEPEYRNDRNYIEHDSMCTIENDKDRSGVNRSSSNFELLASVPIHQNWFCIDSIPNSVYFKIVLLLCDL